MIDTALDAVLAMDTEGMITDWNQQAERIFGWKRDEAVGRRLSETIIPEGDRTAHERGLHHFLETGEGAVLNRRVEMTALRRDGEVFPVELTVTALKLAEDWSFHAFVRDITDRKRAEEALRASEQNLALIINSIPTLACSRGVRTAPSISSTAIFRTTPDSRSNRRGIGVGRRQSIRRIWPA